MGHKNPIKEVQRRFAERPPAAWVAHVDRSEERRQARRDAERDRKGR